MVQGPDSAYQNSSIDWTRDSGPWSGMPNIFDRPDHYSGSNQRTRSAYWIKFGIPILSRAANLQLLTQNRPKWEPWSVQTHTTTKSSIIFKAKPWKHSTIGHENHYNPFTIAQHIKFQRHEAQWIRRSYSNGKSLKNPSNNSIKFHNLYHTTGSSYATHITWILSKIRRKETR